MIEGEFRARIVDVYDGDTVRFDVFLKNETVDLGFGIEYQNRVVGRNWKMRLCDLNAKELRETGGIEARDYLAERVLGRLVKIIVHQVAGTEAQGKYGRWVAQIIYRGDDIGSELISKGHAVYREY